MENKIFKTHPNLERYHETSDGEAFFTDGDAKTHAKSLKDKSIKVVERSGIANDIEVTAEKVTAEKPLKAEEVIELIHGSTTTEQLAPYESDTRSTVKKALDLKKKELEAAGVPSGTNTASGVEGTDSGNGADKA